MATPTLSVIPPLMQLDPKYQTAMKSLVSTVVRSFYDPTLYILVELLMKHHILRDDDLAGRVGLNVKDLSKLMAKLTQPHLVEAYRQNEMKEHQGRIVGKAYYWIDLQRFCNVVKWKISDMRNKIDNSLKSDLDNKGYICPRCTKQFTALEVDRVYDFMRNELVCDVCDTVLIDNENSEKVKGSEDRMQRFNAQMKWIRDGLRNIEGVVMPAFDVARYVREKMAAQRALGAMDEDGLKIAQGGGKAQEVEIHLVDDEDDDEKRKERQRAAEEKRKQNALPSWHTTSTISGEKTALGVKADERSSNDAILAALDAQAKDSDSKGQSYDTFDTEDYYDKLISGDSPPRGTKRKHDEAEGSDPRLAKAPRREGESTPQWPPGAYPGIPYGYPGYYPPMGPGGVPAYPMGYPQPIPQQARATPTPSTSKPAPYYTNGTTPTPPVQQSQSSAGTSRNTPSQQSDSESSQEINGVAAGLVKSVGPGGLAKKKKPSLNGAEKRVSFAKEVSERSPSPHREPEPELPAPTPTITPGQNEYNPWVKVGGKDVRARDVKEGDDELMTADEFEVYWEIKQKLDEMDETA